MPIRRCDSNSYTLATNLAATGSAVAIPGGEYHFTAEGTPSTTTISLQMQSSNGTWMDVQVFSGSAVKSTTLPFSQTGIVLPACNVRVANTGGTVAGLFSYLHGTG